MHRVVHNILTNRIWKVLANSSWLQDDTLYNVHQIRNSTHIQSYKIQQPVQYRTGTVHTATCKWNTKPRCIEAYTKVNSGLGDKTIQWILQTSGVTTKVSSKIGNIDNVMHWIMCKSNWKEAASNGRGEIWCDEQSLICGTGGGDKPQPHDSISSGNIASSHHQSSGRPNHLPHTSNGVRDLGGEKRNQSTPC